MVEETIREIRSVEKEADEIMKQAETRRDEILREAETRAGEIREEMIDDAKEKACAPAADAEARGE